MWEFGTDRTESSLSCAVFAEEAVMSGAACVLEDRWRCWGFLPSLSLRPDGDLNVDLDGRIAASSRLSAGKIRREHFTERKPCSPLFFKFCMKFSFAK